MADPPRRAPEQVMEALAYANEIRSRRATLKREIHDGEIAAEAMIAEPLSWTRTMGVRQLLLAVPQVGPRKVDKILRACRIAESKTIGGLSTRQRIDLLRVLAA